MSTAQMVVATWVFVSGIVADHVIVAIREDALRSFAKSKTLPHWWKLAVASVAVFVIVLAWPVALIYIAMGGRR